MTEKEWLRCTDPHTMLMFLSGKASDRKLRLFGCGCCRRIWHLLTDERSRNAVEIAEKYAEGDVDDELNTARTTAWGVVSSSSMGRPAAAAEAAAEAAWGHDAYGGPYHASLLTYNVFYAVGETASENVAQCILLRDIFGNHFQPLTMDTACLFWRDGIIPKLAQAAYKARQLPSGQLDPSHLAILSDALEEAGCDNEQILGHLRKPGLHIRGCWAVDLLLGKF